MGLIDFLSNLFGRKKKEEKKAKRKKLLGLSLGSGGAKGFAHLGALKAFEEEGIKFDVVTGTSIGSIIGAMYAKGYSSDNIKGIFYSTDFSPVLRYLRIRMSMRPIMIILERYFGELEFSDLKIPFACWATDEDTNEGVLLKEGMLSSACCASSAMPPFFDSVRIGEKNLADGAFTNAVPSDAAKSLGAEFVIGIDLSAYKAEQKKLNPIAAFALNKVNAAVKLETADDAKSRGYENADIMLTPNLKDMRATEISSRAWERMYDEGYSEAKAKMPEIKALLRKNGFGI